MSENHFYMILWCLWLFKYKISLVRVHYYTDHSEKVYYRQLLLVVYQFVSGKGQTDCSW